MSKLNNSLLILAVVLVVVAGINLFNNFDLTGYSVGTDTGDVNLTLESAASVTFVTASINWGSGYVDEEPPAAYLDTEGNVENGTGWTPVSQGLTLENEGNINVTLNFSATNAAADFIGGTKGGGPVYTWKVSENESGSCELGVNISGYTAVTTEHQVACINFGWEDDIDRLDVDINITVPEDATSGAKGSVITATATSIS